MSGIIEMIKNAFAAIAGVFGWMRDRSALKNAPDVKDAKKGQDEVLQQDKYDKAVADNDIETVRRNLNCPKPTDPA